MLSREVLEKRKFFENLTEEALADLELETLEELFKEAPKRKEIRYLILDQMVALAESIAEDEDKQLYYEHWALIGRALPKDKTESVRINTVRKKVLAKTKEAMQYKKYTDNKIIHTRAVHHNSFRGALKSTLTT